MANFPFNDDGTLASTIGANGQRVPTQAALDALSAELGGGSISATDGTTTIAALSSLTLPAGTLTDLGSGAGAVGLLVQWLRFTVNYDDDGFTNPFDTGGGVTLWTPAAGDLILDVWCVPTIAFTGADTATLYLGGNVFYDSLIARVLGANDTPDLIAIGGPEAGGDFLRTHSGTVLNQSLDARISGSAEMTADASNITKSVTWVPTEVSSNGTAIICGATVVGGPLTAGQLRINVVIATPAAS